MVNEKEFILQCLNFTNPNTQKISDLLNKDLDMPWILGQAMFHRVGGIIYYTLSENDLLENINREIKNSLKIIYEYQKIKNKIYFEDLIKINENIKNIDSFVYLKGSILNTAIFPNGTRYSNDYDILIQKSDIQKLDKPLKQNGFIQGKIKENTVIEATRKEILSSLYNRGETVPYVKIDKSHNIEIDLNFSLECKTSQSDELLKNMLANKVTYKIGKYEIASLNKTNFVIFLFLHLYKEAANIWWVNKDRDLSLYKFLDIEVMINDFEQEDINELCNKAKIFDIQKEIYFGVDKLIQISRNNKNLTLYKIILDKLNFKPDEKLNDIVSLSTNEHYYYKDFKEYLFSYNHKKLIVKREEDNV